jgi:predicted Zn-dependent protease
MRSLNKFIFLSLVLFLMLVELPPPDAFGLTVKEEEKLSREVLNIIFKYYDVIEDPVIVDYVNKIGNQIVSVLPEKIFDYHFYVINIDTYNAFAIPAGHIFINSGLLAVMKDDEELAGILGHEIAHVYCRHISQKIERSKKIQLASLAGAAAGILLGVAGGGEAASAVTQGSMAAGQSALLAYSRENEMQADQLGLIYLSDAGYGGEGLLEILKKMRSKQWFGSNQIPTYLMTHPAIDDRIAYLDTQLANQPEASNPQPKKASDEFLRAHLRLITQYGDENLMLRQFESAIRNHPGDPMAHYRYGLILTRVGRRQEALDQLRTALEKRAFDPYILRDVGRIYFLDGQYQQALKTLETAHNRISGDPICGLYLGQTQMELGMLKDASTSFQNLVKKHPNYTEAYYFLGQSLGKQGDLGDAHYYLGIYHIKKRDYPTALAQFKRALKYSSDSERRAEIEKTIKKLENALSKKRKKSG